MRATFHATAWVLRGISVAVMAICVLSAPAFAAGTAVLFPKPLHLVRRIEDPLARTATTVHEYCAGNQLITVNGSRVAIADYDKQQLTEIDRDAGTYSVTRFDEIAKAQTTMATTTMALARKSTDKSAAKADPWKSTPLGARPSAAGRSLDSFELVRGDAREKTTIEVGIDRRVALSRDAVEVLVGASYPNARRDEHDALLRAASGVRGGMRQQTSGSGPAAAEDLAEYGLPVEQLITVESGDARIAVHNSILDVTNDLAPAELVIIPPGSQLVESHTARVARELRELDELPGQVSNH